MADSTIPEDEAAREAEKRAKLRAWKRDYMKRYRASNPDYVSKWFKDNPEKTKGYKQKYYTRDREKVRAAQAAYYQANKEKIIARVLKNTENSKDAKLAYYKKHHQNRKVRMLKDEALKKSYRQRKTASHIRRRGRQESAGGAFQTSDIRDILGMQRHKCAVCRKKLDGSYHADHIMPVNLGGSNGRRNIQILCQRCNLTKHAKHPLDFMRSRGMLL